MDTCFCGSFRERRFPVPKRRRIRVNKHATVCYRNNNDNNNDNLGQIGSHDRPVGLGKHTRGRREFRSGHSHNIRPYIGRESGTCVCVCT